MLNECAVVLLIRGTCWDELWARDVLRMNDYHVLSGRPLLAICRYIMFKWAQKILVFRDHKFIKGWKPEGRKKRGRPRRTWKDGIDTAMNERDLRMGEWNNQRQWNMKFGRCRQMV